MQKTSSFLIFFVCFSLFLVSVHSTTPLLDSYNRHLQQGVCQLPEKCLLPPKKGTGCGEGDLESGPSAAVSAFAVILTMLLIAFAPCPCENRVQRGSAAMKNYMQVADDAISDLSHEQQVSLINTMGQDSTVAKKIFLSNTTKDIEDDTLEYEIHQEADSIIDKLENIVTNLESKRVTIEESATITGNEEEARRIRAIFEIELAQAQGRVEEEKNRQALKLQAQLEKRKFRKEKEANLVQEGSERAKKALEEANAIQQRAILQATIAAESKAAAIAAKKRELEARLATENNKTAEMIASIKATFDLEAQNYSNALEDEKARQEAKLANQIEQRRRTKKAKEETVTKENVQGKQQSSASISPSPSPDIVVGVSIEKKGTGGINNGTLDYTSEVLAILSAVLSEPQFAKLMAPPEERKWWQRGSRYAIPSTDALLAEAEAERKAQEESIEASRKMQQEKLQKQLEARKIKKEKELAIKRV